MTSKTLFTHIQIYSWLTLVVAAVYAVRYWLSFQGDADAFTVDFQLYYKAVEAYSTQNWQAIYESGAITEYMRGTTSYFHPFLNPPFALPVLFPIGLFPYNTALVIWYCCSIGVYLYAVCRLHRWQPVISLPMLLMFCAPHMVVGFITAQTGLLLSGLMILALLGHERKPLLAGLMLALVGLIKPHLVLVCIPLFLGLRCWRLAGYTALFGVAGIIAAAATMPAELWLHYLDHTRLAGEVLRRAPAEYSVMSLSAYMAGLMADIHSTMALLLHICCALVAMATVYRLARIDGAGLRLYACVAVSAFLISPYGFVYDTPLLILPVFYLCHVQKTNPQSRLLLFPLASIAVILPAVQHYGVPYGAILLIAYIVWDYSHKSVHSP